MTERELAVMNEIVELLEELKEDWEYEGELEPNTRFLTDLGLQSLDIVVLSTMVQHRYGRLPFPAWFEAIGKRPPDERDVTLRDLVTFVCEHRQVIGQEA